jgi:hypothetical protein
VKQVKAVLDAARFPTVRHIGTDAPISHKSLSEAMPWEARAEA